MRFGSVVEWVLAAALIALAFATGSVVLREFRTVRAVMPVIAGDTAGVETGLTDVPAGVPPRAVSVPMLQLPDGRNVRVGEPEAGVRARLGREAQLGADTVDGAAGRERVTRFYTYLGIEFVLVFEPFGPRNEPRVSAIYLQ